MTDQGETIIDPHSECAPASFFARGLAGDQVEIFYNSSLKARDCIGQFSKLFSFVIDHPSSSSLH
jgi:hypothetical protein